MGYLTMADINESMPAVGIDCAVPPVLATSGTAVRRTPIYVPSAGERLFAWLHCTSGEALDHAVLICPPIGHEQLHAHRALRHLADELARLAVPVLRLDWHGTGDSPGCDEDPNRVATWLANARDAAWWLRSELGCRLVSVVGLRAGALLAARALSTCEIENFVLWAPPASGRAYVRQMQAIELLSEAVELAPRAESADIEAAGFVLARSTADELASCKLAETVPRCRRALVVTPSEAPADNRIYRQWQSLGIEAEQVSLPGTAEMLLEPHRNQVPCEAIEHIAGWLAQQLADDGASSGQATGIGLPAAMGSQSCRLAAGIREEFFRTRRPELFGIVSQPEVPDERLPTIVLLNSGSAYRIAASRLNVLLARELAAAGFRSLRLDLSGLGDSIAENPGAENDPYAATAFRDIDVAMHELEHRFGARRVVLVGLCSGAYAAFQSAAQLSNAALVESVLVNPLTFFWADGMTLDSPSLEAALQQHRYLSRALDPAKLLKFFTGRTQVGPREALAIVGRRLLRTISASNGPVGDDVEAASSAIGHPRRDDLPGDLARVAAKGRRLAMFFSATDPGYSILNYYARRQANRLRKSGKLDIAIIKGADHTFSRRGSRRELIASLVTHLVRRYRADGCHARGS